MKKSNYTRSTVECRYDELKPAFKKNLKIFAELHKLGDVEREVVQCFTTTNLKKGFLGRMKTSYTVICMTKRFLFFKILTDKEEPGMGAAQWIDISEIHDWEETEMGRMYNDSGIEAFGFLYLSSHRSRWYIGLGRDDAGKKCSTLMKDMINL